MIQFTRQGTPCVDLTEGKPIYFSRSRTNEFIPDPKGDFVLMQILPPITQRFEFVRRRNLIKGVSS